MPSRFVALMDAESSSPERSDASDVDLVEASEAALVIDDAPAPRKRHLRDPIFWVDLEMSGLDPLAHNILEVAVIASDGDLENLIEGPSLCIHHDDSILESMNPWSREQHAKSGLTARCRAS